MKYLSIFLFFITFSALSQEPIEGEYWTPDKDGKIKVYKVGGKYFAKLTWVKDINSQKSKKPDGNSALGEILLKGFVKKKDNLWDEGIICDPVKNKEYSAKLWLDEDNNLIARGFIGISLFGKTVKFERIR